MKKPRIKRAYQSNSVGILLEPLEPRLLLSGSWGAGVEASPAESQANEPGGLGQDIAVLHADANISDPQSWQQHRLQIIGRVDLLANAPVLNGFPEGKATGDGELGTSTDAPSSSVNVVRSRELVFVDTGIQNYAQLIDDIMANADDHRSVEVIVLEADRDGVDQVSRALADRQDLDAIHFLTHGDADGITLGATRLDGDSVQAYANDIAGWKDSLAPQGDILFYGCDLAGGEVGQTLLTRIGALSDADVAASDDLTGSTWLGGDWDLEYRQGDIESQLVLNSTAQQRWSGVLAAFIVDTTADTVDANPGDGVAEDASGNTSLRAAIMEANALGGSHSIALGSDNYDLSIAGASEDLAATGDLDITTDITITGAGANQTTIDGADLDRVFDVRSGTVTLSGLTIQNGTAGLGGGIDTQSASNLTLESVRLTANTATDGGGAIYARGVLNLDRVLVDNNTATNNGGGLRFSVGSVGTITNSTLSGNQAGANGGAIHIFNSPVDIVNSTIAFNSAGSSGGGINSGGSTPPTLVNSILSDNSGGNVSGGVTSLGYNIDSDGTAGFANTGDQSGIDPLLGGLADNGGDLMTHAPAAPEAIDAADRTLSPTTDARGFLRGDGSPDIGAYEVGTSASATADYLDQFNALSYNGDDGALPWSNDWQEIGESDGAFFSGPGVSVYNRLSWGQGLYLFNAPVGAWREANLSGAGSATLSFDWAAASLGASDSITVEISTDGGNNWDVIDNFGSDSALQSISYDISAYIDSNTRIKFESTILNGEFFVDNVRINLTAATPTTTTLTPLKDTYIDSTNAGSNFGSDTVIRVDESTGGLGDGRVLMQFDLGSVPVGAKITSAILQVEATGKTGTAVETSVIDVYEVTEAWDDNTATWLFPWSGEPGAPDTSPSSPPSLEASGVGGHSWDVTALVQDWVSGTKTNNGLMLAGVDTGTVVFDYASSESATPPQLIVTYSGGTATVTNTAALWMSTTGNVGPSGAPGLNAWENGEVIELADPNLQFAPGTTNGTFSSVANLEALAGTNLDVDALHYVTRSITLGTTHTIDLQPGDLLFSTNGLETIASLGSVQRDDIILFRPDTPGDYSSGTFAYVLQGPIGGVDLKSFTLIEQDTTFGDTTLQAGYFLFSQEVGSGNDIYVYHTVDVGDGTTAGTSELLISGSDVGITAAISGLELLETNTTLGDETLAAGELLVSVDALDNLIGTSGITADQRDIFRLQVVKTTAVTGTSVADAALLMDGAPLSLDSNEEDLDALTVVSSGNPTATPSSELTVTTVDDVADGDTSSVAALIGDPGADGEISLREAIIAANNTAGLNTIEFDITGSGPHTIDLSAALPNITGTIVIDGTSEPDYGSAPVVRIDGSALTSEDALRLEHGSTGSTIRGLSVTGFSGGDAIEIRSDYNTIVGNYLGLATNGTTVAGNDVGVMLRDGADFNTIGGSDAVDRNLISGNIYAGVAIWEVGTDENRVVGNWIGLDKNGDVVSAGDHGVVIWDGPYNNQVGGDNPGEGNRIAGHNNGVVVDDNTGADPLDNAILGNEIFAVNEMAIDLDNEQVTTNDAGDGDSGPNDLLNHPELTGVTQDGADLDIDFDLDVELAGDYRIEFFENPAGIGGVGLGEGQVFLGAVTVTHAGSGSQSFSETLIGVTATAIGSVTATATEDLGGGSYGSTSEFCAPGPVNSEQVLAVNTGTTVAEGSTSNLITTAMLETTDVDNTVVQLVYTVTTAPVNGTLYLSGVALASTGTFTQDDINNNRITYDHDGSENFTDSFDFEVDDGEGAVTSDTFSITITPVNDAPTATNLTSTSAYNEGDASVAITDIVVSDVDTGETITATLTLADTSAGSLSANDGATYTAGTGVWTITDTVANVNLALANLVFTPAVNNDVDTTIGVVIDDGDEDASGPLTGTITLDVTPVNDAPTATNLTSTSAYNEGDASVAITDIVVSDADTGETITATLTLADTATGSLSANNGATYTAGTGVWTITDTVANVNLALANLVFTPAVNNDVDTTIGVVIDDGDEDASGPLTGTITLDVSPVNDAPTATNLTSTSAYNEGDASVAITDIVVSDVDTGETITATLTLADTSAGSLSANNGATYTAGTGVWTITDTVANVNLALANLVFTPAVNNDVDTTIGVVIDDGDEDASGPLTGTITLDVTPVNDAPTASGTFTMPATDENTTSTAVQVGAMLADASITANDPDGDMLGIAVLAKTGLGNWQYSTNGASGWTDFGTVNPNAALLLSETTWVRYVPDGVNGEAVGFDFKTWDQTAGSASINGTPELADTVPASGGTGTFSNGAADVTLTVSPVNDAPTATNLTSTSAYNEGDASVAITDIVVSDVDTGETITATLTLADTSAGSLSANNGATYTAGTGVWTITDTVANVNLALANLVFTPAVNNDVDTTIGVVIDDGDEDASGPLTGTITLDVTPVNDAPTATNLTSTSAYNEGDASVAITDIVVSDADTGETITATLTLADTATGSLSANDGATYTAGTGVWTITDTVANVNLALANLVFTPAVNNDVDTTIGVVIDDGDEDASGPLTGTITLDVTPVNDAPTATNLTSTSAYNEGDACVAITDIVVSDVDTGETITATLTLADTSAGSLSANNGGHLHRRHGCVDDHGHGGQRQSGPGQPGVHASRQQRCGHDHRRGDRRRRRRRQRAADRHHHPRRHAGQRCADGQRHLHHAGHG